MNVPMPAASLVHDRLVAVIARGWAELDWSALGLLAASDARDCLGCPIPRKAKPNPGGLLSERAAAAARADRLPQTDDVRQRIHLQCPALLAS